MSKIKSTVSKVELHYFFPGDSHSMDALVRNKCESELLAIMKEISSVTGARLKVETEAFNVGGLVERFVLHAKNELMQGVVAEILSQVLVQEVDLKQVMNEVDKQSRKERVDELRKHLKEVGKEDGGDIDMDAVLNVFYNNLKLIKLKSNFYKHLQGYDKVTKYSVQILDDNNKSLKRATVVSRNQFVKYILETDTLKPETDETAVIEIISPVLKDGNYKWKGLYLKTDRIINFSMKDADFKKEVVSNAVPFKNGTRIECTLEISRKVNEFGEMTVTGYSVPLVVKKQDDEVAVETTQGKTVRKKKEAERQQLDLFGSLFG